MDSNDFGKLIPILLQVKLLGGVEADRDRGSVC